MKRAELLRLIVSQVEAEEQTTARETAENQLTDAQVQIAALEQKIVELQAQLLATSKPKVSFCVRSFCLFIPPLIYLFSHRAKKRHPHLNGHNLTED